MNKAGKSPPLLKSVLGGKCPRCGEASMFNGFLGVTQRCDNCGLSYEFADAGDGPAVLVILFAGAFVVGLWALTSVFFTLTVLTQLAIFIPTIVIVSIGLMRPFKAALIALQYKNQAREGRPDELN